MTDKTRAVSSDIDASHEIMAAQAKSVLEGIGVSLLANSFIALTAAVIVWLEGADRAVLYWIMTVLSVNAARLVTVNVANRLMLAERNPRRALAILSAGALCGGLSWSVSPFIGMGQTAGGINAYVIFIIGGISAGALLQSMAYSRTAILFSAPPMIAMVGGLLFAWTPVTLVIAADALIISAMLVRASLSSEASFIRNQLDRLNAVSLAESLSKANTEIRLSNDHLASLANRDPLTGLGNRALFNQRLRGRLGTPASPPGSLALLAVDLDRFKAINDTLGHGAGDTVLTEIAARITTLTEPSDTVVRLGGDEFAVIVEGNDAAARGRSIGQNIVRLAGEPVLFEGRPVTVGASAGLALYPEHGRSADTLFANADIALYAAKEGGRRRLGMFNPELKARIERKRLIESCLADAIGNDEIQALFQPQVELATGRITGFEALLRWNHPQLGPVTPPDVVRAAQALCISTALTGHIATKAAAFLGDLPRLGLQGVGVAINVSPREFSDDTLSSLLIGIAASHGVDPSLMEIEITEEATLDSSTAGVELARLAAAGFRLAVDDFGMGHSSLAYLASLRIDRLKIDRSFVTGIAVSRENQALIAALIGIGRALSIDIVIEGVETAEEAEVLRMLGCRHAQGYHFARPMPAGAVPGWLTGHAKQYGLAIAAG